MVGIKKLVERHKSFPMAQSQINARAWSQTLGTSGNEP